VFTPDRRQFLEVFDVNWILTFELNTGTPVTSAEGNVRISFGLSIRLFVFELGARIWYRRTDGWTDRRTGNTRIAAH